MDRTFDFDELRDAYAYVDSGRKVGNVVVVMPAVDHDAGERAGRACGRAAKGAAP